jgi:hypothetical protein
MQSAGAGMGLASLPAEMLTVLQISLSPIWEFFISNPELHKMTTVAPGLSRSKMRTLAHTSVAKFSSIQLPMSTYHF